MPQYEYQCLPYQHRFEIRQSIKDDPIQICQVCGGPVRRVIHPVGIVFKGSGFYTTDSRKSTESSKPAAATEAKSPDSSAGSKPSTPAD